MKNIFWMVLFLGIGSVSAHAQWTDVGLTMPEQLGITAGIALACNVDADTLKNYELIASRLMANPAPDEAAERAALKTYAESKLNAFKSQKKKPKLSCGEVLARFEKQPLFESVVYRDGTVKLPDGKIVKPVRSMKKKVN